MKLRFDLNDIKYLKLRYIKNGRIECIKLALKEKVENKFVAIFSKIDVENIATPQEVSIDFICHDGIYKTKATLLSVYNDDDYSHFVIQNPKSLNYQENRNFYRVIAKHDCIYTIDTPNGAKSFDTCTYDLSAGGVSIILSDIAVSKEEMSILIFLPDRDIRAHLQFVRCEIYGDEYKLAFEFTDLSDRDYETLFNLCLKEQLTSD